MGNNNILDVLWVKIWVIISCYLVFKGVKEN